MRPNKHSFQKLTRLCLATGLVGLMGAGVAQAGPPTTNGLFYGNGDNLRYPSQPYAVSDYGSQLFLTLIDTTLYVALVVDRSVNDNVFDCAPPGQCAGTTLDYMQSAGWGSHRNARRLLDSEFAEFTLTLGTGVNEETFTWRQGYGGAATGTNNKTVANWISDHTVSGGGGTPPPGLVSASSFQWNLNNYATRLAAGQNTWVMPGADDNDQRWKSPWNPGDPNTVINAAEGYPATGPITWSPTFEWEWSMVYEWSLDLSSYDEVPVFVVTGLSHHSPGKHGEEDDPFSALDPNDPTPLLDFTDLPAPYLTLLVDDGPRHIVDPNGTRLGAQIDSEPDGIPDANALGDDNSGVDDEDGVVFLTPFVPGSTAIIEVTVTKAAGYLSTFIDFNGDGTLTQATLVSSSGPAALTPGLIGDLHIPQVGTYELTVSVPANATGRMPSLWRITNNAGEGGNSLTGQAASGEVEGHMAAVISGRVWQDTNANGLQDGGEPGLDGITVNLLFDDGTPVLDGDGNAVTTVTAGGGLYEFPGVPQNVDYRVEVERPTNQAFTTFNVDGAGLAGSENSDVDAMTGQTITFSLTQGQSISTVDAGLIPPGTVSGNVFLDTNANATKDPGELNLENITVTITDQYGDIQILTTDSDGNYSTTVAVGDVTAVVDVNDPDLPPGATLTTANATQNLTVVTAQNTQADDVGFVPLMDFSDLPAPYPTLLVDDGPRHIFDATSTRLGTELDTEPNGIPDPNALGDDNDGIDDEDGVVFLTPFVPGGTAIIEVTVSGAAGYLSTFIDFNGDGTLTQATLVSSTGPAALTPGPIGDLHIPQVGTYELTVSVPANATGRMPSLWRITNDEDEGGNTITGFALSGEVEGHMAAVISGRVWQDTNANGLQDGGEPGLDGITVNLLFDDGTPVLDGDGNAVTTVTAGGGLYEFPGVPQNVDYRVEVERPTNQAFTTFNVDGAGLAGSENSDVDAMTGQTITFSLTQGQTLSTVDAGLVPPGTVSGNVFLDTNANATKDPGELNLENITVTITDQYGDFQILTTDSDGNYSTTVTAGSVTAVVDVNDPDLPPGATLTTANATQNLTVVTAQNTQADDVGFVPLMDFSDLPAPYPTLLVDDGPRHIFDATSTRLGTELDTEPNGIPDPNALGDDNDGIDDEDGVVFLTPFVPGGTAIIEVTVSGAAGYLSTFIDFNGDGTLTQATLVSSTGPAALTPGLIGDLHIPQVGTYELTVSVPANATGRMPSLWRITNDEDEGGNSITGFALSGEVEGHMAAAISGRVWQDTNANGLQDGGEPGLDGITVNLLFADGTPVLDSGNNPVTTVTAGGGLYEFPGVPQNVDYRVEVERPSNQNLAFTTFNVDGAGLAGADNSDVDVLTGRTIVFSLTQGQTLSTVDAGLVPPGTVSGNVFLDVDGNAIKDPGEPDLENITVTITDQYGDIQTLTTDADGNYSTTVAVGNVTAVVDVNDPDIPFGAVLTTANATQNLTVVTAQNTQADDVGFQPTKPLMIFTQTANTVTTGVLDATESYTYTLYFENVAPVNDLTTAINLVIDDVLPFVNVFEDQILFIDLEFGPGYSGSFTRTDENLTIFINENVDPGESGIITLFVTAIDPLPNQSVINHATLNYEDQNGDPMDPIPTVTSLDVGVLLVELDSFTVTIRPSDNRLVVEWTTTAEFGAVGFDLIRVGQTPGSKSSGVPINSEMILAEGSPISGASYSFVDPIPYTPGETRGYILVETELSGNTIHYGPAWFPEPPGAQTSVEDWLMY